MLLGYGPLAHEEEGQQVQGEPDNRHCQDGQRPSARGRLRPETQRRGERLHAQGRDAERDRAERANTRHHTVSSRLVAEGRTDESPQRHVAERVCDAPEHVTDAEERQLECLRPARHREQQRGQHHDRKRREQDERPHLAPAGVGAVDDRADDRIGHRIDGFGAGQDRRHDEDSLNADVRELHQVERDEGRNRGEHRILAERGRDDRDALGAG